MATVRRGCGGAGECRQSAALQVAAAEQAGLDPTRLAASNSGHVLGKTISPQNLAIAAGAGGLAGQEGGIFPKVLGWSLLFLPSTPLLSWVVVWSPCTRLRGSRSCG